MAKEKKNRMIGDLKDKFTRANILFVTDYRGISARKMDEVRRHLGSFGMEYKVIKNTLAGRAADEIGKNKLESLLTGPVGVAFGYDDAVKQAKALVDFIKSSGLTLDIKGGYMDGNLLSGKDIQALASLPPKEVLIARLLGTLIYPVQGLHTVLAAPIRGFLTVLKGRMEQLENN